MRKFRQLHLWIGLITSLFILVEAITGLLLSETWLMGQTSSQKEMRMPAQSTNPSASPTAGSTGNSTDANANTAVSRKPEGFGQQGSSLAGWVHQLHEGRVGSTNLKWLVDITAIALIILTLTGIALSIQTLRAQSRSRKRRNG
ncbi:PepSY-associated TM helix domain-containing protein [Paenibacillus hexagrammi]|uniref:PepSY domain-containing protein n=1 Tax=Paenibacillus hexagrammi TaxID=2908839 RepID=A0ABY3SH72_9BACL|nr:PepSY-associated TM helix domain-containing protein [Paenibacillus sp. YPD9-1]UJF32536.1 PepSY domain-containing protein [Paenibacillus sp. YPD9-1]